LIVLYCLILSLTDQKKYPLLWQAGTFQVHLQDARRVLAENQNTLK
jgi:hypothetical protein